MKLSILVSTALLSASVLAAGSFALTHRPLSAVAAGATGTVTGRVVWNAPIPVPYGGAQGAPGVASPGQVAPGETVPSQPSLDGSAAPTSEAAPGVTPGAVGAMPAPGTSGVIPAPGIPIRPIPWPYPRLIPAGAVLVAIQGTNLSARTDDQGRFSIENVPVGQYLTVAAGPVQSVTAAVSIRPNVFLQNGGQTVDLGRLYLGQVYSYYGPVPYGAAPGAAAPDAATPGTSQTQP